MAQNNALLPSPSSSAIFKPLAEGGVLFSTDTEVYFGVNVIGARIWGLLPPVTRTFGDLYEILGTQYSDVSAAQIARDVDKFLDDLRENGLVDDPSPNGPPAEAGPETHP